MSMAASAQTVLCVDIGGTSTKFGLFSLPDRLTYLESIDTAGSPEQFAASICRALERTRQAALRKNEEPLGVGVAVAGFLNEERDRLVYNSNIAWLEQYPLRGHIASEFDLPIELDVDSNAAAIAEHRLGWGRNCERFMCIAVGTGLGVGMIVHGEPLRFAYGCMGDPGHIIVKPNGPLCTCGGHGCAEILVSAPFLADRYRIESGEDSVSSLRPVIQSALAGNELARSILQDAGKWLGIATASLANTFYPERIAFAGGLAEAGNILLNSVEKSFNYSVSKFARDQVVLGKAQLGAMATLTGAAFSVLAHHTAASGEINHER